MRLVTSRRVGSGGVAPAKTERSAMLFASAPPDVNRTCDVGCLRRVHDRLGDRAAYHHFLRIPRVMRRRDVDVAGVALMRRCGEPTTPRSADRPVSSVDPGAP